MVTRRIFPKFKQAQIDTLILLRDCSSERAKFVQLSTVDRKLSRRVRVLLPKSCAVLRTPYMLVDCLIRKVEVVDTAVGSRTTVVRGTSNAVEGFGSDGICSPSYQVLAPPGLPRQLTHC